jgi:hypothetical protein
MQMIIGFSGYARSGKDTAAQELQRSMGFRVMHFADPLKNAAKEIFGFSMEQLYGNLKETVDPFWGISPREALQKLGTEGGRNVFGEELWVKALMRRLEDHDRENYVIADVRFPNEARAIEALGGHVVRVVRPGIASVKPHESETALDTWPFKHTIVNDASIEEFFGNVRDLARYTLR